MLKTNVMLLYSKNLKAGGVCRNVHCNVNCNFPNLNF